MLCPSCKKKNAEGAKRCMHCAATILPGEGLPEPKESAIPDILIGLTVVLVLAGVMAGVFWTELRNALNPDAQVEVECMDETRARLSHDLTPERGWRRAEPSLLQFDEVCFERDLPSGTDAP